MTSEDTPDASAVLQLAANKQAVIAGTYYNEDTQASRPVQGMVDAKSQRAVMKFADGKDADLVLETGVYNLTQEEAPARCTSGRQSQPILLVRLNRQPNERDATRPDAGWFGVWSRLPVPRSRE